MITLSKQLLLAIFFIGLALGALFALSVTTKEPLLIDCHAPHSHC